MAKGWQWHYPKLTIFVFLLGIFTCFLSFYFRLNLSNSLPQTIFLSSTISPPFKKNQIVSINHPFIPKTVGKIIVGLPGERIQIDNQSIFINEQKVGVVKDKSSSGKSYHAITPGEIPAGHYFVYTPHPDSFDSRYQEFGLIPEEWIQEGLWPIF